MKFSNQFGTTSRYRLDKAILVYTSAGQEKSYGDAPKEKAMATVHDVRQDPGGPVIGEGRGVTLESIQQLAFSLSNVSERAVEFFPPELLSLSMTRMVWHRPPCRRTLWFQPMSAEKGPGKRLLKLSGEEFPQPHLVFVAESGSLAVFAVRTRSRPTPQTPLYHAPHFNIYSHGGMCVGTARVPKQLGPDQIPRFEAAFFESNFTHASHRICSHPKGPAAMWVGARRLKAFPTEYLIAAKRTLGSLIKPRTATHD